MKTAPVAPIPIPPGLSLPMRLLVHARAKRPIRITPPRIHIAPPLPPNRAYLKALRQAEMSVWNRSNAIVAPETTRTRGVHFDANPTGSWVPWVLAACAGLSLLQNIRGSVELSQPWQHFATIISQLLG